MTALIVLVVLLAALGVAVVLGHGADSRDPDYGLGRVIEGCARPVTRLAGR